MTRAGSPLTPLLQRRAAERRDGAMSAGDAELRAARRACALRA